MLGRYRKPKRKIGRGVPKMLNPPSPPIYCWESPLKHEEKINSRCEAVLGYVGCVRTVGKKSSDHEDAVYFHCNMDKWTLKNIMRDHWYYLEDKSAADILRYVCNQRRFYNRVI